MLTNEGTHQLVEESMLFDARTALNTLTRLEHNGLPVLASYDLTTTTLRVIWNVPAQCEIQVPEPMLSDAMAALRHLSGMALRRTSTQGSWITTPVIASWQVTSSDGDDTDDDLSQSRATLNVALSSNSKS